MAEDGIFERRIVIGPDGTQEDDLPVVVVDTSYVASAILADYTSDEATEARDVLQEIIEAGGQFIVPQLFWFEIGNVLLNAAKPRKGGRAPRITKNQLDDIMLLLSDLPIYTDPQPDAMVRSRVMAIAQEEHLSYYDAAYLELARRKDVRLKTWDADLQEAASRL